MAKKMSYIENNLLRNEIIVSKGKIHWSACFLCLVFAIPTYGISALYYWLYYKNNEIALTNRRLIMKTGIIRQDTYDVSLHRVESITVDQGLLGRIFGYGTITVKGIGGTPWKRKNLSEPFKFRDEIIGEVEKIIK